MQSVRGSRDPCCSTPRGTWLLCTWLLALLAVHQAAAQIEPTAAPAAEGPIELHLVAAYGPGLVRPATGPTLIAKAINGKRINCQLRNVGGVRARAASASTRSVIAPALDAAPAPSLVAAAAVAAAAAPAELTACKGDLVSGKYNLLASYIEGATFAQWACYVLTPGTAVASAAELAESPLMSSQVVDLAAGNSYTCVATYSKASKAAQAAAAAIDWNEAVATAAAVATQATAAGDCPVPAYIQPKRASWSKPIAPIVIQGNQMLGANNAPLAIRGINWFGFNVAMGMVDGLWAGGTDLATDFGKITYQLRLLGYNAVRLPFTFTNLASTKVWDLVRECKVTTAAELKQRLVDPQEWAANSGKAVPGNPAPLGDTSRGMCNSYLPTRMNEDRLLFVLQQFNALGLYVILDYQPQGTEDHAYDLNRFVSSWAALWKKVTCLPNFDTDLAGRIFVDVMNEPDSMGIRWEASGNRPGAQQLYLGVADALWAATPNKVRFLMEGTGQNSFGLNWGNGFVTDPQVIQSRGLSNPTAFFQYLVGKPYAKYGGVVLSPHVYPPTITGNTFLGTELYAQCNTAFGYLQTKGFCDGGACTKFPVLVGETGSAMVQATDIQWLNDFSDYVYARGAAASYNSVPLKGWLWWAYNENSGDTGGIVMNQWQDINWPKIRMMVNKYGLQPWWRLVNRRRGRLPDPGSVVTTERAAAAVAAVAERVPAEPVVAAAIAAAVEP